MGYSLKDVATDFVKGEMEYVTQEVRTKRIEVCELCVENSMRICKVCGCAIPLKTTLKKASCPLGKW